mgnify:CR=1 FL=1
MRHVRRIDQVVEGYQSHDADGRVRLVDRTTNIVGVERRRRRHIEG